ncbi:MAG: hypothetical protein B7X90_13110, partial [Novosphingobium sp. 17-62-19]|uniref:hypothetical protein n=1 Tax=Novosphingobium sp. 17-62-19 TaxID=1970406 RepID=UPI000BD7F3EC
ATANGSQNSPTGAATYRPSKLTPTGHRNRRATGEEPSGRSTLTAMALTVLENDWRKALVAEPCHQISAETGLMQLIVPE